MTKRRRGQLMDVQMRIFSPAPVVQVDAVLIIAHLQLVSSCYVATFRRMGNNASSSGGPSSTACVQYVQEVVSQNCVVIFSKTTCPYCKMAKNVFNEIGATYKVIELDEHNDGRSLQEALAQMTGARTVPRVFINGNCIGGGSDTRQLHQQGKLVPLIEQCAPCCAASSSEGSGSGQFESAK